MIGDGKRGDLRPGKGFGDGLDCDDIGCFGLGGCWGGEGHGSRGSNSAVDDDWDRSACYGDGCDGYVVSVCKLQE